MSTRWAIAHTKTWHVLGTCEGRGVYDSRCGRAWLHWSESQPDPPASARACISCSLWASKQPVAALRAENARLLALLDTRTTLLRECDSKFVSGVEWSGTDSSENQCCPSCYLEWWDVESQKECAAYDGEEWDGEYPTHASDCELIDLSQRIARALKEKTCDS